MLAIVTPVFNDWASFYKLIKEINAIALKNNFDSPIKIFAVDDASTELYDEQIPENILFEKVEVYKISLTRNVGHQRAIAIGLCYVYENFEPKNIVIMDSDGEDDPNDIFRMLEFSQKENKIVFAKRARRNEGVIFKIFYVMYRKIFKILTGKAINFGNFCIIPQNYLSKIVNLNEIWNHFAAGLIRSKLPITSLSTNRGKRYFGQSKMNFVGLILHGLSAVSIFTDIMTVRLILFCFALIFSLIVSFCWLVYFKYFTPYAVPGWASTVGFGLLVILFQIFLFVSSLSFNVLNSKNTIFFIPIKQYKDFYNKSEKII